MADDFPLRDDAFTTVPQRPLPGYNRVTALRESVEKLMACSDPERLFETMLECLPIHFDVQYARVLMLDESGTCLYTAASGGDAGTRNSPELPLGEGMIGVAALHRTPLRDNRLSPSLSNRTVRDVKSGITVSRSQLAAPLLRHGQLLGMLHVESSRQHFTPEDEDTLAMLAHCLALTISMCVARDGAQSVWRPDARETAVAGGRAVIRHYAADDSIFINGDYLIKGVAGAILWKLVREHRDHQRCEFCNRELRRDPSLGLPAVIENLETRLILLQRRLAERCPFVTIEKTGRGRFRLRVDRPLQLSEA